MNCCSAMARASQVGTRRPFVVITSVAKPSRIFPQGGDDRRPAYLPSRSVQHELCVGEVAELWSARALEIFAAELLCVDTDKAGNRLIGIDGHRDIAEPQQQPADAAGTGGVFGGAAAVYHLHRGRRDEATADTYR